MKIDDNNTQVDKGNTLKPLTKGLVVIKLYKQLCLLDRCNMNRYRQYPEAVN